MEIIISPDKNKTEEKYFTIQNHQLKVKPFKSKISGLTLVLQNANGHHKQIPLSDTEVGVNENISEFGYFWFEYSSCDIEYKLTVTIE